MFRVNHVQQYIMAHRILQSDPPMVDMMLAQEPIVGIKNSHSFLNVVETRY